MNVSTALTAVLAVCPNMDDVESRELSKVVLFASEISSQPVSLLAALMMKESSCDKDKVNEITGAVGLFQIMPSSASFTLMGKKTEKRRIRLLIDTIKDPMLNAYLGGTILKKALKKCKGNVSEAISMYNGHGRCEVTKFSEEVIALQATVPGSS